MQLHNEKGKKYKVNFNKQTGTLLGLSKNTGYPTFVIELDHVDEVFEGSTYPWDTHSFKAQMVFGGGPETLATRAIIKKEYTSLYQSETNEVKEGTLYNAEDFLKLLNYGRSEQGSIIFYTYVIIGNQFRFSPTGILLKDLLSKHTVHANCSPEVVYAGEFHIRECLEDSGEKHHILVIDNSSGTYKPDEIALPKVAQLLQLNFTRLIVSAVHHGGNQHTTFLSEAKAHNNSISKIK